MGSGRTSSFAGHLLRQSLNQVSQAVRRATSNSPGCFAALAEVAIAEGDLRSDLDANDFAQAGFAAILGSHLLAGAIGDDVCARMAQIWRVMMPGIVAPEAVGYWRCPSPALNSGTFSRIEDRFPAAQDPDHHVAAGLFA